MCRQSCSLNIVVKWAEWIQTRYLLKHHETIIHLARLTGMYVCIWWGDNGYKHSFVLYWKSNFWQFFETRAEQGFTEILGNKHFCLKVIFFFCSIVCIFHRSPDAFCVLFLVTRVKYIAESDIQNAMSMFWCSLFRTVFFKSRFGLVQ